MTDLLKLGRAVELTGLFIACAIKTNKDKRWAINQLKKLIKKLEGKEVKIGE
jgi:hypothetical protein